MKLYNHFFQPDKAIPTYEETQGRGPAATTIEAGWGSSDYAAGSSPGGGFVDADGGGDHVDDFIDFGRGAGDGNGQGTQSGIGIEDNDPETELGYLPHFTPITDFDPAPITLETPITTCMPSTALRQPQIDWSELTIEHCRPQPGLEEPIMPYPVGSTIPFYS